MNKFDNIFNFLNKFGGTSFIADKTKSNYDDERYKEIFSLKAKAYDEDLVKLFDDVYNKLKYKDNKIKCKIRSWQNSGKIYDYCWLHIKDKDRQNSASGIMILIQKERLAINLEYHHSFNNSENSLKEHNKYVLSLDKWIQNYNIDIDKYVVLYREDNNPKQEMKRLKLIEFISDISLRKNIESKILNNEDTHVILEKEFSRDYIMQCENFEDEIVKAMDELEFLYSKTNSKHFGQSKNIVEIYGDIIVVDTINKIENYIKNQGYNYTYNQLSNLYLSLKTKPFVILAGISGTGKSKIINLFAESLGATAQNNRYKMISVRPDWNDNTDLIGYKNLNDQFIDGELTKIIKEAIKPENKNKPYFICLDEMNLARVEYYLSDYLSVIESRKKIGQEIITDNLIDEDKLYIPENVYIIGTVNMDDTTFQFSRKVLDRANTIEFSEVDLEDLFVESYEENVEPLLVNNDFLKTTYLKTLDIEVEYRDYAKEINKKIIEINEILKKSQKQFAYRVRDEILFYMIENKKSELLEENIAFDYQIMQKILPTINGSENSIKQILVDLYNFVCEKKVINDIDDINLEEGYEYLTNAKYKMSAEKILYMLKGYVNDGYSSFWC